MNATILTATDADVASLGYFQEISLDEGIALKRAGLARVSCEFVPMEPLARATT